MSTFWVVAGALTLAVVALLAVPLLRRTQRAPQVEQDGSNVALFEDQLSELLRDRDQGVLSAEQFEQARIELGQRLLADVPAQASGAVPPRTGSLGAWRYAVLACVPVGAVLGYLVIGTPQAIEADLRGDGNSAERAQKLDQLIVRLTERLEAKPDDAEAWVLLARSLQMLGRAPEAVKAFSRATELVPNSAQLLADYAAVQVAAADGQWTPGAIEALRKALAADPQHPKALWLGGTEAYARKDYRAALAHWEKLAPMAEPGSDVARIIQENIAEVRGLLGAGAPPAVTAKPAPDAASGKVPEGKATAAVMAVSGTVVLDPKLAAQVKPTDTVFVFARAAQGPKMPLAIRRIQAQDLPFEFSLDDSAAMAPGMTISAFDRVVIGARISRSGNAAPQPGDLQGHSAPVKPGSGGIEVRIDARIP